MTMRKAFMVLAISLCTETLAPGDASAQSVNCAGLSIPDCITRHGWQNLTPWNSIDHDKWRQLFYSARWGRRPNCMIAQQDTAWLLWAADTQMLWGDSSTNAGHFFDLTTSTGTGGTTSVRVVVVNRNQSEEQTFVTLTHEASHRAGYGHSGYINAWGQEACFESFSNM